MVNNFLVFIFYFLVPSPPLTPKTRIIKMLKYLNNPYTLKHNNNFSFHFINTLHPYQARTKSGLRSNLSHFLTNIILSNSQKPISSFFMVKSPLFFHLRNVNFPKWGYWGYWGYWGFWVNSKW